jgi:hypothetical protein
VGTAGPRLRTGGAGPIAVTVQDLSGNGLPDLVVFNGGGGTVTELAGVGNGFFDDRQPLSLLDFGAALLQPPTFVGTTGFGYEVTAGGDLVSFNLFSPYLGAPVAYSGQPVVAAQALASGEVVVALADGSVNLLQPQGSGLALASVLEAQGGVPALPSAIDVVSKPGGQFNVLVSSEGSDHLFVFAMAESGIEGGGPLPGGSPPPALNLAQSPALASATQGFTFTAGAITNIASASTSSTSASTSASSSSTSATVAATTTIGLSLGTFSSLGNGSGRGNSVAVLVPIEGNTYLSVPILELGAEGEEDDAGKGRMPWLSSLYNIGDTSALTRFVTGLDEALEDYRGLDDAFPIRDASEGRDPWREDLFFHHLSNEAANPQPRLDEPAPAGPGPRTDARRARVLFPQDTSHHAAVEPIGPSHRLARVVSAAGLFVAAHAWPAIRHTKRIVGPGMADARRRLRTHAGLPRHDPQ